VSGGRDGQGTFSLRWILIHLIEEYARHNGHADFIRERLDGATGQQRGRQPVGAVGGRSPPARAR
jgi:hypothetical protein